MPCDVDSFLEMLPPQLLAREWGKTWWQALIYPWWCHQASFSFPWHHHSLFWLAGSLSVMPPSGNSLIFTPFLGAERSRVIILSWILRHTRRAFLFLHWTPYASSLPWLSQVLVRQDMSCWDLLQPVSISFKLVHPPDMWPHSWSLLLVWAVSTPHYISRISFVVMFLFLEHRL